MAYATEPVQGIVRRNKGLVKKKDRSEEQQRVCEVCREQSREMAGSVTKLGYYESGIRTCNQGLAGQRM